MAVNFDPYLAVVIHLTGTPLDGSWLMVPLGPVKVAWEGGPVVELVATGDVEWRDDAAAEVWVPADRLAEWQSEHPIDA